MFQNISNRDYVFAWKSIESFGRINALLEANSNAKVIYIIRNPCGQIASVINGERRGNFLAANRSSEDYDYFSLLADSEEGKRIELDMTKVREIDPIERMALRWMLCNEKAIADIGRYRNRGLIVKYEDLCVDPLKKAKEMFDFVGLEWNVQTEDFIQRSISMSSASYYSVFKNPIESMNRWKSQLSEEEVNAISRIVGNSEAAKTIYLDT